MQGCDWRLLFLTPQPVLRLPPSCRWGGDARVAEARASLVQVDERAMRPGEKVYWNGQHRTLSSLAKYGSSAVKRKLCFWVSLDPGD